MSSKGNDAKSLDKKQRISSVTSAGGPDTTPDIIFTKSRLLAETAINPSSSNFGEDDAIFIDHLELNKKGAERESEGDDQDSSPIDTFNLDNLPSTGTKPIRHKIAPKMDVHSPLPSKYAHVGKSMDQSRGTGTQPRLIPKVNKIPDNYEDVL
jgi:hypothetical protein